MSWLIDNMEEAEAICGLLAGALCCEGRDARGFPLRQASMWLSVYWVCCLCLARGLYILTTFTFARVSRKVRSTNRFVWSVSATEWGNPLSSVFF